MHVGRFLHSNCIEFNRSTRAPRVVCVRMHVHVCLMGMKNAGEGWDTKEVHSSVAPLQIMLVLLSCLEMGRNGVCAHGLWGQDNSFNWNKSPAFKG